MTRQCPKCKAENPDTSSYCADCGTQLGPPQDIPSHTKTLETPYPQFSPGKLLVDRYEIIRELGKGGMGEVYLAEDTNLKRQVAIKILPQAFAVDEERMARFEREARLLASLSHPNIATVYGLEKSDGQQFLVMELIEGDTLAERIKKGPLPVEEALELCRHIAEGLESAHEKGIIHRDLKPSNVKVTPDGKVKILDFGLAKAFHEEPTASAPDLSKSPTLTDQMTRPGVIIGTAAYMSPEQARSRAVDKRADIWAFGCVLYECLTGEPVLQGETVTDTLALVLKGEPNWDRLPASTPPNISTLLRRCLKKDPRSRLRDIGDARIEIEEVKEPRIEEIAGKKYFPTAWIIGIASAGIILGLLIGVIGYKIATKEVSPLPIKSTIKIEPEYKLVVKRGGGSISIAHDGSFICYHASKDDKQRNVQAWQLFRKDQNNLRGEPIKGTEGGGYPFLSPDSRWIAFWRDAKLWKVPVQGGVAQELCPASYFFGASWGPDDRIVFSDAPGGGLYRIAADGGEVEELTVPETEKKEFSHRLPSHLPNGRGLLFTIMSRGMDITPRIAVLESDMKTYKKILPDASDARYLPTGHLVFLRRGTLMAVAFDLQKLKPSGEPIALIQGIEHALNQSDGIKNTAQGQYDFSDTGSLVYVPGGIGPNRRATLAWYDKQMNQEQISSKIAPIWAPRLSPDGKKIVYLTTGTEEHIWILDIDRDIHRRIVSEGWADWPIWTPDGSGIIFSWTDSNTYNMYRVTADGSGPKECILPSQNTQIASSFSPDGKRMAFLEASATWDILIYDFEDQSISPFAASEYTEMYPEFSPKSGRWIAYSSDEEGQDEVFIRPSSGIGKKEKVSRSGGTQPAWTRDEKTLYFKSEYYLWEVDIQTEPILKVGTPRKISKAAGDSYPLRGYDISMDGQRFLGISGIPNEDSPGLPTEMIFVQNWSEEIKRLVPTGK